MQCSSSATERLGGWGNDFCEVWDLGEQWWQTTNLPFVFAMWVARPVEDPARLSAGLEAARDAGLRAAHEIAVEQAERYGLTVEACTAYFERFLHFKLGLREQRGLELFYQRAVEVGLAPSGREHLLLQSTS